MSSLTVRPPAVAGQFYPADPDRLEAEVRRYLVEGDGPEDCEDYPLIKAIIAPHAGYTYSGTVAAAAYLQLACSDIPVRRFILIGPAHYAPVRGLAISGAAAFDTPLGRVPVDDAIRTALLSAAAVTVDDDAHAPEHSLEVQLPFLQELFLDFSIVPLLVGDTTAGEVAAALEIVWGEADTRVIVSSDLSHFHDYETAQSLDRETAKAIVAMKPEALREDSACGRVAIAGLLMAARRRGMHSETITLRNSADTGGPRDRVVGYGAFLFSEPAPAAF